MDPSCIKGADEIHPASSECGTSCPCREDYEDLDIYGLYRKFASMSVETGVEAESSCSVQDDDGWAAGWKDVAEAKKVEIFRDEYRRGCPCPLDFEEILGKWDEVKIEPEVYDPKLKLFVADLDAVVMKFLKSEKPDTDLPANLKRLFAHEHFSSLKFLEKVRSLGSEKDSLYQTLGQLLCLYWMKTSKFTKVLYSLCTRLEKNRGHKMTVYYNASILSAQLFYSEAQVVQFLLNKTETVLRLLFCQQNEMSLPDVYSEPLRILLERTYIRYYVDCQNSPTMPFHKFILQLHRCSKLGYFAQRLISKVLSQLTYPVTVYLAKDMFSLPENHMFAANQLLYPSKPYLSGLNGDWNRTIISHIPFKTNTQSASFWKNWSSYITSEPSVISSIWQEYTEEFWRRCLEPKHLPVRAFAFVAFAAMLRPIIDSDPYSVSLVASSMMKHVEKIMLTTDVKLHGIGYVLTYVMMDLAERQITKEQKVSLERLYEASGDFAYMINFYEQREEMNSALDPLVKNGNGVQNLPAKVEQTEESSALECTPELILKLRTAGKIPSNFLDVLNIVTGNTQGSDEVETEALQQLAVVWTPILLMGHHALDDRGIIEISKFLFSRYCEGIERELCVLAAHDLCARYPVVVSNQLADNLASNNYSIGQKLDFLNLAQGIIYHAGHLCCSNCFEIQSTQEKRQKILSRVRQLEPQFISDYLKVKPVMWYCYDCQDQAKIKENEDKVFASSVAKPVEAKALSKTRTWGVKRPTSLKMSRKLCPHLCLWSSVYGYLEKNMNKFQGDLSNDPDAVLLIRVVNFLKTIVVTYGGITQNLYPLLPQAIRIVEAFTTNPLVRRDALAVLKDIVVRDPNLAQQFSLYLENNDLGKAGWFRKHLYTDIGKDNETDATVFKLWDRFHE